MSERLTEVPPATGRVARSAAGLRGPVQLVAGILAAYVLVGLGAGWVWHELWHSSEGVVIQHQWYADGEGLREDFSGTGLYVLVAAGAGLVLGGVCALLGGRRPVLTLVACVTGSLLAGWLMLHLGERLGPADPAELAKNADDGTRLPSALRVSGLSAQFAFPVGTLAALALVFTILPGKSCEAEFPEEPRG